MSILRAPRFNLVFPFILGVVYLSQVESHAQKFEVGLKAAGSYNNTYGQGTSSFLPVATYGGSFGGYSTFQLFEKFKIRAEALFSMREFTTQYSSVGGSSTSLYSGYKPSLAPSSTVSTGPADSFFATLSQQTVYLDIPAGVDYEIKYPIHLQAGAMLSIFLNEWNSSLSNNSTIGLSRPADSKYYQQYQFYVYAGAYYQFNFKLSAGLRANLGLTDPFVKVSSGTGNQVYPYSYQLFVTYPLFKF
jgi:hypothetical protein